MPSGRSRTERGRFLFTVSERGAASNNFFISAEPIGGYTTSLIGDSAFLTLDVHASDREEAESIAKFLNQKIDSVSFTVFDDHPMYAIKPTE